MSPALAQSRLVLSKAGDFGGKPPFLGPVLRLLTPVLTQEARSTIHSIYFLSKEALIENGIYWN